MPSIVKSPAWFVRVDGPMEFLQEKCKILSVECVKILAVYHSGKTGENPHCHFVCTVLKEIQKQSWDVKIKKLFDVKGTQYASKVWDGNDTTEGAGTYLFHESETSPILCRKGYSDEALVLLKAEAVLINKVIAKSQEKASNRIPILLLKIWEEAGKPDWSPYDIVCQIVHMSARGECYLPKGDFIWKNYVEEIRLAMSDTPEKIQAFANRTYDRIFNSKF